METQKGSSAYLQFWLPKNIEDPNVIAAVGIYLRAMPGLCLVGIGIVSVFYYLGAFAIAVATIEWLCVVLLTFFIIKAGFYRAGRALHIGNSAIFLPICTVMMGVQSYMWVYLVNTAVGSLFFLAPSERSLRRYCLGVNFAGLILTFYLKYLNVITVDVPAQYAENIGYFGIFNVLTCMLVLAVDLIRYQAAVTSYKTQLEQQTLTMVQQAKMSTLGEMAAGVAHEINNPLGVIIGKIDVWKSRFEQNQIDMSKVITDFGKIQVVAQRIAKIVSSLRTFSRDAENDPFQISKCSEVLEQTMNFCAENLKAHKIDLRLSINQNFEIECRPTQISQVLVNLINNSFDAIRDLPEKWIEINADLAGGKGRFTVTDSGHGISEKIADKIMQPFFTTKEIGKGTGLGLSVSKGIIETHKGTLQLDRSCVNTRFVIDLPAHNNNVK